MTSVSFWSGNELPMHACRKRLVSIWLGLGMLALMLLTLRTMVGAYGSASEDVWKWFLPAIVPTMSLMLGVLVSAEARRKPGEQRQEPTVSGFLYRIALWLSLGYLGFLIGIIIYEALDASGPSMPVLIENIEMFVVHGFQVINGIALGAFFTKG